MEAVADESGAAGAGVTEKLAFESDGFVGVIAPVVGAEASDTALVEFTSLSVKVCPCRHLLKGFFSRCRLVSKVKMEASVDRYK